MSKVVDVAKYLSQAAANAWDGAYNEDGKPIEVGLRREKQKSPFKVRTMDAFNVRLSGDKLLLTYHSDMLTSDYHDKKFKENVLATVKDILSWLKKEYKRLSGETLSLTEFGEPDIEVQNTSRIRSFFIAKCFYKIGNISAGDDKDATREKLDKKVKEWFDINKDEYSGTKKDKADLR